MGTQQVAQFEKTPPLSVWSEVGSRMMVRGVFAFNDPENGQGVYIDDGWQNVQDGVYRYAGAPLPGQVPGRRSGLGCMKRRIAQP